MTATTLTIADFILARVAEDEAGARAASQGGWDFGGIDSIAGGMLYDETRTIASVVYEQREDHDGSIVRHMLAGEANANGRHIARHDPARVLAECESKRAIVEQFRPGRIVLHDSTGVRAQTGEVDDPRGVDVLRALASVYADHPDFDPAWSMAAEFAVGPGPAWGA